MTTRNSLCLIFACGLFTATFIHNPLSGQDLSGVNPTVQQKLVKIYGSGGFANLHSYQTGLFISGTGQVVTAWSHVLDGKITIVDSTGRRTKAKFVGMDPETELAILDTGMQRQSFFDLGKKKKVFPGMRITAVSNLFGIAAKNEKLSIMRGVVSTLSTLDGKSGQFNTPYRGQVIVVDVITNNPGAAGGVIVDHRGELLGVIGKELKDRSTGIWLNFGIPVSVVHASVKKIQTGQLTRLNQPTKVDLPFSMTDIGLELVPEVVETTRPFVDRTVKGSLSDSSGFKPDDLILFVAGVPVRTIEEVRTQLDTIDRNSNVTFTVRRNDKVVDIVVAKNANALGER